MNNLKIGDLVSVALYDKHERRDKRIGSPAKVLDVRATRCESGFMITVKGKSGKIIELDQNWMEKLLI